MSVVAVGGPVLLIGVPSPARGAPLVGLMGVLTAGPLIVRGLQHRFDPFEPLTVFCAGAFAIFVLRPLWMWAEQDWVFDIYDLRDGLTGASTIVCVGMAGVLLGYCTHAGKRLAAQVPMLSDSWHAPRVAFACLAIAVGALLMFSLFIGSSGGFGALISYFAGRESSVTASLTQTLSGDSSSSGYFYLAPYALVPITLVLLEVWRRKRAPIYGTAGLLSLLTVLTLTVPRGDRTFILAVLFPLAAIPFLRRDTRPRVVSILLIVLLGIIAASALLSFRTIETRNQSLPETVASNVSRPLDTVSDFMLSVDMGMFSVLAAEYDVVPRKLGFKPAQVLTSTALLPVPGPLWQAKPDSPDAYVYAELFPKNAAKSTAGLSPSLFGTFYADSGYAGVFVYALLVGLALRTLFEWRNRDPGNPSMNVTYAALLPMIIILLRGNPSSTIGLSLFLVAPLLVVFWWGGRQKRGGWLARGS